MKNIALEIDRAVRNGEDIGDIFRRHRIVEVLHALGRGARVALIGSDNPFREQLSLMAKQAQIGTGGLLSEQDSNALFDREIRTKSLGSLLVQSHPAEFFFI